SGATPRPGSWWARPPRGGARPRAPGVTATTRRARWERGSVGPSGRPPSGTTPARARAGAPSPAPPADHSGAGKPGNVPGVPLRLAEGGEQATQVNGWQLRFDADGNLVEKRSATTAYRMAYDAAGRLTQVTRNGRETTTFAYDALGRRVRKGGPAG